MPNTSVITMLLPRPGDSEPSTDYDFAYVAGQDSPSSIKGVKIFGVPGEIVRQWTLLLDATEILNVDNVPITKDDMRDALDALASEHRIVTFVDNTGSVWRDESETITAKIEELTIMESSPQGGAIIRMVVTEVT